MEVSSINSSRIPISKDLILGIQKKQINDYFRDPSLPVSSQQSKRTSGTQTPSDTWKQQNPTRSSILHGYQTNFIDKIKMKNEMKK